jgi:hypothetical protein
MSEVISQSVELENLKDKYKAQIELAAMARKLEANHEFRKVILEAFCRDECARYAQASADPALKAEERADAMALAQASGHLLRFLHVTSQMGLYADNRMPELDQAIVEARAEEDAR